MREIEGEKEEDGKRKRERMRKREREIIRGKLWERSIKKIGRDRNRERHRKGMEREKAKRGR